MRLLAESAYTCQGQKSQQFTSEEKVAIFTLKNASSIINKKAETPETLLAVSTACHQKGRPVHWAKYGRYFLKCKRRVAAKGWCCFKMHENCMNWVKLWVWRGVGSLICIWASKPVASAVTSSQAWDTAILVLMKGIKCCSASLPLEPVAVFMVEICGLFSMTAMHCTAAITQRLSRPLSTHKQTRSIYIIPLIVCSIWGFENGQIKKKKNYNVKNISVIHATSLIF